MLINVSTLRLPLHLSALSLCRFISLCSLCALRQEQVISDKNTNFALSLGYDGNLLAWNFNSSATWNPNAVYAPACTFMGHQAPILECECLDECLEDMMSGAW